MALLDVLALLDATSIYRGAIIRIGNAPATSDGPSRSRPMHCSRAIMRGRQLPALARLCFDVSVELSVSSEVLTLPPRGRTSGRDLFPKVRKNLAEYYCRAVVFNCWPIWR
jgi:hypothetical protein